MANLPRKHIKRGGEVKARVYCLFARLSPHRVSQRCCIPGSPASPGAVEQTPLYVRDREGGGVVAGADETRGRERERERGLARWRDLCWSLFCQTCARASAAAAASPPSPPPPPLRCVSALAERRTQSRGEGRDAERKNGDAVGHSTDSKEQITPTHQHPHRPLSRNTSSGDLTCAARALSFPAWRLR